jgi:predicted unusual protein kinase regulating ubiquinone biosynthesis (AarF/ABC1/UbiB family)
VKLLENRVLRGFRIGRLSLGLTGSYLGYQFQNLFLDEQTRESKKRSFQAIAARRIRRELESLKGPVMKLGQMLSMQSHLLSDDVVAELGNLQMRAPPMHPTLARAQFKASFGRFPEEVFRSFTPEPFAAASLGQVHQAITQEGEIVAVKIQYPAIRSAIEDDFKLLRSLAMPARIRGRQHELVFAELEEGILRETDYKNEGQNIDFFRERLKPLPFVRVPLVHWDYSTDRILTMSFIPGEPLPYFLKEMRPSQTERDEIGQRLLKLFEVQLHRIHAMHVDPHPGNYLIDKDGTIGLVDFGCVKRFSADFIELMRAFERRAWLEGERESRRMLQLIWGPEIHKQPRLAAKLFRNVLDFYEMLFPSPGTGSTVIDFGDPKFLNMMIHLWKDSLQCKSVNPEFVFYQRAEMGLYNLLHFLRARLNPTVAVAEVDKQIGADKREAPHLSGLKR